MVYYVIIRGPLGCGKSTIAKAISKKLEAKYFAIDKILDDYDLKEWEEGYVSQKSFIRANEIAAKEAKIDLEKGVPIVFDGNFYWKSQIEDLIKRLNHSHYTFTLKAPLKICIERDMKRNKIHGKDATEAVYKKSTEFDYGTIINVKNKTQEKVVKEILSYLPMFKPKT